MNAIEFHHVGKIYRLGTIGTGTLSHDLNRWWQTAILHREDPYLKIGQTNDRTQKSEEQYVWALRDIDFSVEQGDVVGVIGKNGAGKSTLLKLLSNITSPTTGEIVHRGRIASLLEVGTGFHPEMTGRENIYMNGAIMGMTRQEITRKLDDIVDFSGCARYVDTPLKRYSSGMTVRLGFAIAAFLEPEILVVDEVLAVGDAEFQKKAIGKMQEVSQGDGRTVLFVSHNMASIRALCKKGVLLQNGLLKYSGDITSVVDEYMKSFMAETSDVAIKDLPRGCKTSNLIRFTNIEYLDKNNVPIQPHTGQFLRIRLTLQVSQDSKNCNIAIGIRNNFGTSLLNFPTNITLNALNLSKGVHYLCCDIPRLPLTEGEYLLGLWAEIDMQCADYIDNLVSIQVEVDDFFGTGRLTTGALNGKIVLCDHNWFEQQ